MKNIISIELFGDSEITAPTINHVAHMINEGYMEGEVAQPTPDQSDIIRGYWQYQKDVIDDVSFTGEEKVSRSTPYIRFNLDGRITFSKALCTKLGLKEGMGVTIEIISGAKQLRVKFIKVKKMKDKSYELRYKGVRSMLMIQQKQIVDAIVEYLGHQNYGIKSITYDRHDPIVIFEKV